MKLEVTDTLTGKIVTAVEDYAYLCETELFLPVAPEYIVGWAVKTLKSGKCHLFIERRSPIVDNPNFFIAAPYHYVPRIIPDEVATP